MRCCKESVLEVMSAYFLARQKSAFVCLISFSNSTRCSSNSLSAWDTSFRRCAANFWARRSIHIYIVEKKGGKVTKGAYLSFLAANAPTYTTTGVPQHQAQIMVLANSLSLHPCDKDYEDIVMKR